MGNCKWKLNELEKKATKHCILDQILFLDTCSKLYQVCNAAAV